MPNCHISWTSSYDFGSFPSDDFLPQTLSCHVRFTKICPIQPIQRVDNFTILKFDIPPRDFIFPQSTSMTQSSTQPVLSLQASLSYCPFAGLTYDPNLLSFPLHVSSSRLLTFFSDFQWCCGSCLQVGAWGCRLKQIGGHGGWPGYLFTEWYSGLGGPGNRSM